MEKCKIRKQRFQIGRYKRPVRGILVANEDQWCGTVGETRAGRNHIIFVPLRSNHALLQMKSLVFAVLLFLFASSVSCKKCYQCTTTVTYPPINNVTDTLVQGEEVCGSRKDKQNYISAREGVTTEFINGQPVQVTSSVSCR